MRFSSIEKKRRKKETVLTVWSNFKRYHHWVQEKAKHFPI